MPLRLGDLRSEQLFLNESGVDKKTTKKEKVSPNDFVGKREPGRVFLFPTLQMDVVNYREDEELFLKLLKEHNGDLRLATGYLNLTKEYLQAMGQRDG